jgi:hypothetical protein
VKSRILWFVLLVVVVAALWGAFLRRPSGSEKSPPGALTKDATGLVTTSGTTTRKSAVVIQTGQERMSNAVRCMLYVVDLANGLPKERNGIKRHIAATAGMLYFEDSLMSKMSNGYITITSNELRQNFSNALAQLFTNNIPPEILDGFDKSFSAPTNAFGEFVDAGNVPRDLVQGFKSSFRDRNNMRMSVDDQYAQMAKSPELARTLKAFDSAFQQVGITDADQSDLKEICLAFGESRTSAYLIYGPQSSLPMPAEYQTYAESLDKVLKWRLVNMYGLDDSAAAALIQALSRVPVNGFSHAGLQVPALIQ